MILHKIQQEQKRIAKAWTYSLNGLTETFRQEAAFRLEVILALVMIPIALLIPTDIGYKCLLVFSVFFVLVVELLNSATEWTINYISKARHPLAKRVKDIASAAVMLSLINCGMTWGLVIFSLFNE